MGKNEKLKMKNEKMAIGKKKFRWPLFASRKLITMRSPRGAEWHRRTHCAFRVCALAEMETL